MLDFQSQLFRKAQPMVSALPSIDAPPNPFDEALANLPADSPGIDPVSSGPGAAGIDEAPKDDSASLGRGAAIPPLMPAGSPSSSAIAGAPEKASGSAPQRAPFGGGFTAREHGIKNPVLRTLAEIGDVAGSSLFPGITAMIPGSRLNEERAQGIEQGREKTQAGIEHEEAETEQQKAAAKKSNAEAQGEWIPVPGVTDQNGQPVEHNKITGEFRSGTGTKVQPLKPANEWVAVNGIVDAQGNPVEMNKSTGEFRPAQGAGKVSPLKEPTQTFEEQTYDEWHQTHPKGTRMEFDAEKAKMVKTPQEPGNYVPVPDAKGNTIGWVDPKSGHYRSVASIEGLGTAVGGTSIAQKPTTQERNVSAQAEQVLQGIPDVLKEIDALQGDLGPVGGRFNEFMQGKVGSNDPKFAGLRADLLMLSSAVALMHARGRLPENLREEFDSAINSPKQTAGNLRATIEHVQTWAQRAAQMGQAKPEQPGGGGPQAGAVENGFRFKGGDPKDKNNWEKAKP